MNRLNKPKEVEELHLVDMDDTLVIKSELNKLLLSIVSRTERESLERHNAERIAAIRSGKTGNIYDPSKYLLDPSATFTKFVELAYRGKGYIYDDAIPFLERLRQDSSLILSFGADMYQNAKFATLGSELPIHVTDNPDKTELLRERHDGIFYNIGGFAARSIVLVDDREYSFVDFDLLPNARGIFLDRPEFADSNSDDHRGRGVPSAGNVIRVTSLDQIKI